MKADTDFNFIGNKEIGEVKNDGNLMYERMSLDEAEILIRKIESEKVQLEEEMKLYEEDFRKKFPIDKFSPWDAEAKKNKEYQEGEKKLFEYVKRTSGDNRVYNLTHILPIQKAKRNCHNCAYVVCEKRDLCTKHKIPITEVVCDEYRFPNKKEVWYAKPHFLTPGELAKEKAKSLEEKIEEKVQQVLKEYQVCLNQTDSIEATYTAEVNPIPKEVLDEYETHVNAWKRNQEAFEQCIDMKTETIQDGPLKGVSMHSFKLNKDKVKKLFEKGMLSCPLGRINGKKGK